MANSWGEIIIVRHGMAERQSPSGRDFDRRLVPRGEAEARFVGQTLRSEARLPGLVVHSAAERAARTAALIALELAIAPGDLQTAPELLVDEPVSALLALVDRLAHHTASAPPAPRRLLIAGHNPQLERAATVLCPPLAGWSMSTGECVALGAPRASSAGASPGMTLLGRWRLPDEG